MNKKKLVTGLLSAAFLGGVLVTTSLSADAATYGQSSNGSVTFKPGGLVNPPINPPIIPPTPTPSGDFGLLYVPTEFNFAETAVPSTTLTADTVIPIDPAEGTTAQTNPLTKHFAVGDVRGLRASGWKLEAKLAANLTTGTKHLTGATITMRQGINELTPATPPTNPWTSVATTPGAGAHTPDTVTGYAPSTEVTLSVASTTVMSASGETGAGLADGRGEGYWEGELTNIELNVPAAAMNAVLAGEQYQGTIDWTLTDSI